MIQSHPRRTYAALSSTGIDLHPEDHGTHPLRRTQACIIYKQTSNPYALQILLGRAKIASTVRFLIGER